MKYRKKPLNGEGLKLTLDNLLEVIDFAEQKVNAMDLVWDRAGNLTSVKIETFGGSHVAHIGDYILKSETGEFWVETTDTFKKTYDSVD